MMWFRRAQPDPAPDPELERISANLLSAIEEDEKDRMEWERHRIEVGMMLDWGGYKPGRWRRFVYWIRGRK